MQKICRQSGLSANTLKLIAVAAMILQHCAILFLSHETATYILFCSLGKITAPVMSYFIAEGFHYTHDRKGYLKRLFIFALISHIPHALAFGFPIWMFWKYTSVMWSHTMGLTALMIFYHRQWSKPLRILGILACCALSYPGNWNCVVVIWILGFGIFRDQPVKKWVMFLLGILVNVLEFFIIETDGALITNVAFILPVLLLTQYNGQRGKTSLWIKRFFYWSYPIHLLVIYGIHLLTVSV